MNKKVAKALRAISNHDMDKMRERYLYLFHLNTEISRLTNQEIWIRILIEYFEGKKDETTTDDGNE